LLSKFETDLFPFNSYIFTDRKIKIKQQFERVYEEEEDEYEKKIRKLKVGLQRVSEERDECERKIRQQKVELEKFSEEMEQLKVELEEVYEERDKYYEQLLDIMKNICNNI